MLNVENLLEIDPDILAEAVYRLKEKGDSLNFKNLYRTIVTVVAEKEDIEDVIVGINFKWAISPIVLVSDERAIDILKKYGLYAEKCEKEVES